MLNNDLFEYIVNKYNNHPSIDIINSKNISTVFEFRYTDETEVKSVISKLDINKTMGYDFISSKIIKLCSNNIAHVVVKLINACIDKHIFPCEMKLADVASIFKKNDRLDESNYRPISILIIMSKVFEKIFASRITMYFHDIFSPYLSAYREGYNCEQVLIKFICMWKESLDNNNYFGAVLMDLSKAFDCLPHCLIVAKLNAYGFSKNSCLLIASYLYNRKQRVKIGSSRSDWLQLKKESHKALLSGRFFLIFLLTIYFIL